MKTPLYSGTPVPWSRVIADYRKALVPLAIVLAVNLMLLVVVVLPLSQRVEAREQRATEAARAEAAANAEFQQAEALREGNTRATKDLQTFYQQVLPTDVAAARRVTQSKILRLAEAHDVHYERGSSDTKEIRNSALEQFTFELTLTGTYDDIRGFIYELETAHEFVVIDNIVLGEGRDASGELSLQVQLSTYYRSPTAAAPATNAR